MVAMVMAQTQHFKIIFDIIGESRLHGRSSPAHQNAPQLICGRLLIPNIINSKDNTYNGISSNCRGCDVKKKEL